LWVAVVVLVALVLEAEGDIQASFFLRISKLPSSPLAAVAVAVLAIQVETPAVDLLLQALPVLLELVMELVVLEVLVMEAVLAETHLQPVVHLPVAVVVAVVPVAALVVLVAAVAVAGAAVAVVPTSVDGAVIMVVLVGLVELP
jgi:hypothetical protein